MKLVIGTASDDQIGYEFGTDNGAFGVGEKEFEVRLPNGLKLIAHVEWVGHGWEFTLTGLPIGSKVSPLEEEEDDDEDEDDSDDEDDD